MEDHPSNRFVDLWEQQVSRYHTERSPLAGAIKASLQLLSLNVEVFANHSFGQHYINPFFLIWTFCKTSFAPAVFSLTLIWIVYFAYFQYEYLIIALPIFGLTLCLMVVHSLIELLLRRRGIKINNQAQGTPNLYFVIRHQFFVSDWFFYFFYPIIWLGIALILFAISHIFAPYLVFASAYFIRNVMIGLGNYNYVDSVIDEDIKGRDVDRRMKERQYKNTHWRAEESEDEDEFASDAKKKD